jgi:hypothetical protein
MSATANPFPAEGGCDCKRVRYRMQSPPLVVHCCHCRWCQRETGASFALNAMIGLGQRIARCPECQVAVWSHYAGAGPLIKFVRVGTLDDPDLLRPDIHIFTESKQPWFTLPMGAPAVAQYYKRDQYWSPESLVRYRAMEPRLAEYRAARKAKS